MGLKVILIGFSNPLIFLFPTVAEITREFVTLLNSVRSRFSLASLAAVKSLLFFNTSNTTLVPFGNCSLISAREKSASLRLEAQQVPKIILKVVMIVLS